MVTKLVGAQFRYYTVFCACVCACAMVCAGSDDFQAEYMNENRLPLYEQSYT